MLLVVAIPDIAALDADSIASWALLDSAGSLLRSGRDRLAAMPRAEKVIATVPAARIVFIETPLPAVGSAKREALLRYAIEDKLTIDPATIHAAVLGAVAAPDGSDTRNARETRYIIAAIDRSWFAAALAWLAAAQLPAAAVYAETDALAVAAGEWAVVIGSEHGFARRDDGYAYALDTAGREAPPFALRLALGEVAVPPTRITLYTAGGADGAGGAVDDALLARWQEALGIALRAGGELRSALIGSRLAQLKTGNLLTQEFTPRRAATAWLQRMKPAMIALLLLASLHLAFNVADWWRLERQRRALDVEMRATFKSAFPQAAAIVDPPLQMQRNLAELKKARGLARDDDVRMLLARLADIGRNTPQLAISEVSVRNNSAILRGSLDTSASVEALRQQLKRVAGAELLVGAAQAGKGPAVEISLKAGS